MENTTKIILILIIFCSCQKEYYNEQGKKVYKKLYQIKNNLYKDKRDNLYFLSEKNMVTEDYKISVKGIVIQDSIFYNDNLVPLNTIVNLKNYRCLINNTIYMDDKYVYMNRGSQYSNYPFYISPFNPSKFSLLSNNIYFRYEDNIFYFGYMGYIRLDSADADKFRIDSVKTIEGKTLYIGFDNNKIYHNTEQITLENLKDMPISFKIKDSIRKKYFNK